MACGCNKPASNRSMLTVDAVTAGARVYHDVYLAGEFTGRRFTSVIAADTYAKSIGGEVRPSG